MDILLGIILFFVLLYYALKLFLRYGLPWLIGRFMHNQQNKYQQQQGFNTDKKEGEVRVKMDKRKKSKDDSGFGEYVDYEDVKE
jgi:hypothetical protein